MRRKSNSHSHRTPKNTTDSRALKRHTPLSRSNAPSLLRLTHRSPDFCGQTKPNATWVAEESHSQFGCSSQMGAPSPIFGLGKLVDQATWLTSFCFVRTLQIWVFFLFDFWLGLPCGTTSYAQQSANTTPLRQLLCGATRAAGRIGGWLKDHV